MPQTPPKQGSYFNKKVIFIAFLFLVSFIFSYNFFNNRNKIGDNQISKARQEESKPITPQELAKSYPQTSPTPTPTPKPLTFSELNTLYGPCVYLPTLFYHHIQNLDVAAIKHQGNLTVSTSNFKMQMDYLKSKGYTTISPSALISFFDSGVPIPKKSILITFDDAYDDFYVNAYPILTSEGFTGVMFTPTGLVGNPGYLRWDEIQQMSLSIYFANHTWSHKSVLNSLSVDQNEITTADTQLSEKGYNADKIFAYPYGPPSANGESVLKNLNYKLAFTTRSGSALCSKQRFELPRLRVGNFNLNNLGL